MISIALSIVYCRITHYQPFTCGWLADWSQVAHQFWSQPTQSFPRYREDIDSVINIMLQNYPPFTSGWLVSSRTPISKSIDPAVPEISQAVTHPSTNRARCCLTSAKRKHSVWGSNPAEYDRAPVWYILGQKKTTETYSARRKLRKRTRPLENYVLTRPPEN